MVDRIDRSTLTPASLATLDELIQPQVVEGRTLREICSDRGLELKVAKARIDALGEELLRQA